MTYRPSPELVAANAALVEALRRTSEAPPASHGASTAVTAKNRNAARAGEEARRPSEDKGGAANTMRGQRGHDDAPRGKSGHRQTGEEG